LRSAQIERRGTIHSAELGVSFAPLRGLPIVVPFLAPIVSGMFPRISYFSHFPRDMGA
jgi:hypothetical protein